MTPSSKIISLVFLLLIFIPKVTFSQSPTQLVKPEEVNFSSVVGSGARASGMGGAFIAIADDATAASWNPAGLAQLVKPEISLVYHYNNFNTSFPKMNTILGFYALPYQIKKSDGNINFLSFAFPVQTKQYKIVPQISYQRVIDLSVDSELDEPYQSRFGGTSFSYDQLGKYTGGFDMASLSIGMKFSPLLSLGATLNFWFNGQRGTNDIDLIQDWGTGLPEFKNKIHNKSESKVSGFNLNVGALLNPYNDLMIGLVFRTPVTLDFKETIESLTNGEIDSSETYTRTGDLNLPYSIGFGISYRPNKKLTLSSDFTYSNWSEGKLKNIKKIYLDGIEEIALEEPFPGNKLSSTSREQNNTRQFRIGAEYIFLINKFLIPLRSGFFTNTPYITDGKNKSINYIGFTTGIGVAFSDFLLDAAFVYQNGSSFYSEFANGDRKFKSYQIYISAIYRFDFFK